MEGSQRAKDNALQIQAEVINVGISEEDVRKIISLENEKTIRETQIIAANIAQSRLDEYANILIPKLIKGEILQAFSEPSFQMLLGKTQRTAICTERKFDYEMLSELLIHRVSKKENYSVSAAISRIVELIDQISEDALLSLTLYFCVTSLYALEGNIRVGLSIINDMFEKIICDNKMPNDPLWLDNLEIVQAIRMIPFSKRESFEEFYSKKFDGYFCVGINGNSENYERIVEKMNEVGLHKNVLVQNEYLENYYRIPIPAREEIENITYVVKDSNSVTNNVMLTNDQKEVLYEIFDSYDKNSNLLTQVKEKIFKDIENYSSLQKVREWWNKNIANKQTFSITFIGNVLSNVNAKRLNSDIPELIE